MDAGRSDEEKKEVKCSADQESEGERGTLIRCPEWASRARSKRVAEGSEESEEGTGREQKGRLASVQVWPRRSADAKRFASSRNATSRSNLCEFSSPKRNPRRRLAGNNEKGESPSLSLRVRLPALIPEMRSSGGKRNMQSDRTPIGFETNTDQS